MPDDNGYRWQVAVFILLPEVGTGFIQTRNDSERWLRHLNFTDFGIVNYHLVLDLSAKTDLSL